MQKYLTMSLFLKGHIQRVDGHYVCSCGFKRGISIYLSESNLGYITLCKCANCS